MMSCLASLCYINSYVYEKPEQLEAVAEPKNSPGMAMTCFAIIVPLEAGAFLY